MASFSSALIIVSSQTPIPRTKISEIKKINLNTTPTSFPTIPKFTTSQSHKIVSKPQRTFNYLTTQPVIADESCLENLDVVEVFKQILGKVGADSFECLAMIDAVQRLGIDHYFVQQNEEVLGKTYALFCENGLLGRNIYKAALSFRLLRQHGYHVPAGIFNVFKDGKGRFKHELSTDIIGLLELYEASQLSIEGEDILDEAREFSVQHLKAWEEKLNHSHARVVKNTLDLPYHKSQSRVTVSNLLANLQGCTNEWMYALQGLAMRDFNLVHSLHRHEIMQFSKWWNNLGLAKELEFVRDQPVKWHIWSLASLADPSLSEERIELTKPISLIYVIDDIFDVKGSLEELTLFTEVISRWDYAAIERLPDYMKICFKALHEITNEISHKVYQKHGWNPVDSLRKTWVNLCNAFLVEAKWFASGEQPNPDEYLRNGIISSGVHIMLVHVFFLLGQGLKKENVEEIDNNPGIISSVATIFRLWDDLGSAKDENQEGQDGSYVDFYMKEHQGVRVEEARNHVNQMISEAWKQLNQECLFPNPFSSSFKNASLNLARMVPFMYSYDENQRLPSLEDYMKSLL
ncbi:hypothetical protein SLE2022_014440 [Rubroshorea leprosula]